MSSSLLCYSFHSVKGGVGKSTLAVCTAHALAGMLEPLKRTDTAVVLMDMDLTGTSLADVLELEAPRWPGLSDDAPLDVLAPRPPDAFWSSAQTRVRIEARQRQLENAMRVPAANLVVSHRPAPWKLPFLNDHLLFATRDWKAPQDIPIEALLWRGTGDLEGVYVIPSSALPDDLEHMLPLIYDEERAAYLEGRLERLMAALMKRFPRLLLVIDTPPTLPGLSRSVLSLGLRLGREPKQALAEGQDLAADLSMAEIHWYAQLVATPDLQDLRAMHRWLELVRPEEQRVLHFLINRAPLEPGDRARILESAFSGSANALALNPLWVSELEDFQIFRSTADLSGSTSRLDALGALLLDAQAWLERAE